MGAGSWAQSPAFATTGVVIWLLALFPALVRGDNYSQPISIFRSRPDLIAPAVTIFAHEQDRVAPGYFFISPYQQEQEGPHIYDNHGNLIWTSFGGSSAGVSHAPQVCNYRGQPHLCFYQGTQLVGWGMGHGVIMDNHYQVVKTISAGSYSSSTDMHEFRLTKDGKSALMTQYLRSAYDLCEFGICNGLGYIQQGAFQEVDVETGKVLFEWRSLDHVDVHESYVLPGTTEISGNGRDPALPWDYFHINSIDKNDNGDYLISARHTSCIYLISGKDGHIIWRLNGVKSDYRLRGFTDEYGFSSQHDARFVSDTASETTISLFDNGSNGYNLTQDWSTGQIIALNHNDGTATLVKEHQAPLWEGRDRQMSKSQGSMQILSNGNVLLGWGNNAYWSENSPDGTPVWYGRIGVSNVMNYRVHKFEKWVGDPLTVPAMWTYSKTGHESDGMMVYISWNGATEVKQWSVHTATSRDGPWTWAATVEKSGFETIFHHERFSEYTQVIALDKDDKMLSKSVPQPTFVPSDALRPNCDELACFSSMVDEEEMQRLDDEAKERQAELQRAQDEKEERNEARRKKQYIASVSSMGGLVLVMIMFALRRLLIRPLMAFRFYAMDVLSYALRRRGHGRRGLYKELANGDLDDRADSGMAMNI